MDTLLSHEAMRENLSYWQMEWPSWWCRTHDYTCTYCICTTHTHL